jgi:hypothetical protein
VPGWHFRCPPGRRDIILYPRDCSTDCGAVHSRENADLRNCRRTSNPSATKHLISSLYNFVNVPSAAWIDEQGRIVRINEGTYAKQHKLAGRTIGTDDYTSALRDWVQQGASSQYVWSKDQVASKIRNKSNEEVKAEALFQLGAYFHQQQNRPRALQYWKQAQALFPDSWNMHRQEWAIDEPQNAGSNWMQKVRGLKKPYYADLELQQSPQVQ